MAPARFTSFLVKVASRCNLDCDYCYVYHHADQSWRTMPQLLSPDNQRAFARRLAEYVMAAELKSCVVVFHGGEPLLMGADKLAAFAELLRSSTSATVEIGLQTNGLLLTEPVLTILEEADIAVSLSLDGPRAVNDKHRTTKKRRSSFNRVLAGLSLLKQHPKIFAGIIAVIDPETPPEELFAFFDEHQPPKLDFLLPDSHHLRPPQGRAEDPDLYSRWLTRAFDVWLEDYPHLPVRTFEALLDAVSGLPSTTDAFGLGDVSLITIETDGSYHDLDVLKVTRDGATRLGGTLVDTPILAIANSEGVAAHRQLLRTEGLCEKCQTCPIMDVCGGGSLPHRYGPDGFNQPTIYCGEMQALVGHVRERLESLLAAGQAPLPECPPDLDLSEFEEAERAAPVMDRLCSDASDAFVREVTKAIETLPADDDVAQQVQTRWAERNQSEREAFALEPGVVAWQRARRAQANGHAVFAVDGAPLTATTEYLAAVLDQVRAKDILLVVGAVDPWLRLPFGQAIYFEDEQIARQARLVVEKALAIIDEWRPALGAEIRTACRAIQFVRDPLAHPDKIVSFSDNAVPGALYVSVLQGDQLIDPYDLADSLVHEHRHQKLYLLERIAPMTEPTEEKVASPWREDLRPPSGLLHAVFVFVELRRLWTYIRDKGPARLHNRAINQLRETDGHLADAFRTLEACPLTSAGRALVEVLKRAVEREVALA